MIEKQLKTQSDFVKENFSKNPLQGLVEAVWNALDAEATKVEIFLEESGSGDISRVIVRDNGTGIRRSLALEHFALIGGSWKKHRSMSENDLRILHGSKGCGRLTFQSIGSDGY